MNQVHLSNLSKLQGMLTSINIVQGMTFRTNKPTRKTVSGKTRVQSHYSPLALRTFKTRVQLHYSPLTLRTFKTRIQLHYSPLALRTFPECHQNEYNTRYKTRDNHSCLIKYFSKMNQGFIKTL